MIEKTLPKIPQDIKDSKRSSRLLWFWGALLVLMTVAAYLPAFDAGYIWDDDFYVTENPLLTAPDGLGRIWFSTDSPSQYFPLVYTTFRIEHSLWGLEPAGYHITNIIIHALNALLLWWLLARIGIRPAWLAAALFALHPVHTESVAWITERKNVLMAFFFFLSLIAWIEFVDRSGRSARSGRSLRPVLFYILSLALFALSLFSKTTACTLPAALVLVLWMRRIPLGVKRWLQIVPYLSMGAAMGLISIWWEQNVHNVKMTALSLDPLERILVASRALWFYLYKLVWPTDLSFSYTKWEIDGGDPLQYGWLALLAAVAWAVWHWRKALGRGFIAAPVFFAATLVPMLGFFILWTFTYSYVADHYQYVASIGITTLIAALCHGAAQRLGPAAKKGAVLVAAIVVIGLGALTWDRCHVYKDSEALWTDTIAKSENSWMGHLNLGNIRMDREELDEAADHFVAALAINPSSVNARNNLARVLMAQDRVDDAIEQLRVALEKLPFEPALNLNMAKALETKGRTGDAMAHYKKVLKANPTHAGAHESLASIYQSQRKLSLALSHYRAALRADPDAVNALFKLAWILATSDDGAVRNPAEAVNLAQRACTLTAFENARVIDTLAVALAAAGRFGEAVSTARKAITVARSAGQTQVAARIEMHLRLFQARKPLRAQ